VTAAVPVTRKAAAPRLWSWQTARRYPRRGDLRRLSAAAHRGGHRRAPADLNQPVAGRPWARPGRPRLGPLARDRPAWARRGEPSLVRGACRTARRRDRSPDRARDRRPARPHLRLPGRLGRPRDHAVRGPSLRRSRDHRATHDRRDLPGQRNGRHDHPGHLARTRPGPHCAERDDRLQGRAICPRRCAVRPADPGDPAAPPAAQPRRPDHRPGVIVRGGRAGNRKRPCPSSACYARMRTGRHGATWSPRRPM